jgi:hypothetical protein
MNFSTSMLQEVNYASGYFFLFMIFNIFCYLRCASADSDLNMDRDWDRFLPCFIFLFSVFAGLPNTLSFFYI